MGLKVLLGAFIFALVDVVATVVILAHGNQFDLFISSIRDKTMATQCLDFFILSIIRGALLIGGVIGVIRNPSIALKRVESVGNYVLPGTIAMVLYLLTKLLIYSETEVFLKQLPSVKWFWMSFGWGMLATFTTLYIFGKLGGADKTTKQVKVDTPEIDENSPLLGDTKNYSSTINVPTQTESLNSNNSDSSDTSTSGYSDNENDNVEKDKKKEKKNKSFTELVNKVTITKMLSYSKKDFHIIALAIFFLLGAAIAEIFIPLFTGRVISGIAIEQDTAKFTKNIIIMALITMAASISAGCRGGLMTLAIARFNIRIRNHLFQSLTNQEIGFFDTTKTGEVTSRLTSDTSTMSDMIGLNCNIFLRSVVKGVGTCVFMFSLSWRLSIVTFMGLPLVIGVSKLYGTYYKKLQTQVQDAFASANEVAEEVISSMKTVRSFANENGENERYAERMHEVYKVKKKQALAYAGYMSSTEINVLALITTTLWYGGHLVLNNYMKSQNLISFILYQLTLGESMASIGSVYTGLMQALGAAEKVFTLIDREPKITLNKGELKPSKFDGSIAFENVTFAYPSRPKQHVLKNVSFVAPPGQVTALVGPSGGGKSSCVNLLQHFYETVSGCIRIDGSPVEKYCHKYLHQKISLVGQEPVLYARSIKENIAYGMDADEYGMTDVVEAARKANAHSFISELPEQYKTQTGEKGLQLSGGQKQRVAIARALIRNPRILILDEATSALDTESEYLVQQALQKTMQNRTVVVIAHRLSTVENADKIVVIDKGEVIEQGTHKDLMTKSGMYYKLVHRQLHHYQKRERKKTESAGDKSVVRSLSTSKDIDIPASSLLSRSLGSSTSHSDDDSRPSSVKI